MEIKNKSQINGYQLTRAWFDFAFEKIEAKVIHTALFMWILELNNRLNWKRQFGLPTQDTMEGLSIGNKKTYLTALKDLSDWGFIKVIQESKNQYSACIIEICRVKNATAQHTALNPALQQHSLLPCQKSNGTEHSTDYSNDISTGSSTAPIDKLLNNETNKLSNIETTNDEKELKLPFPDSFGRYKNMDEVETVLLSQEVWLSELGMTKHLGNLENTRDYVKKFFKYCRLCGENHLTEKDAKRHCLNLKNIPEFHTVNDDNLSNKNGGDKPSYEGTDMERVGKWIWLNEDWRDTTSFNNYLRDKYGV